MLRRLFTVASVLSLVFCMGTAVLWVRGSRGVRVYPLLQGDPLLEVETSDDGMITIIVTSARSLEDDPNADGDTAIIFGPFAYGRDSDHRNTRDWNVVFPVWFPAMITAVLPAAWLWRKLLKRGRSPGSCSSCGYDLRASKGRCPECGTPIPSTAMPAEKSDISN